MTGQRRRQSCSLFAPSIEEREGYRPLMSSPHRVMNRTLTLGQPGNLSPFGTKWREATAVLNCPPCRSGVRAGTTDPAGRAGRLLDWHHLCRRPLHNRDAQVWGDPPPTPGTRTGRANCGRGGTPSTDARPGHLCRFLVLSPHLPRYLDTNSEARYPSPEEKKTAGWPRYLANQWAVTTCRSTCWTRMYSLPGLNYHLVIPPRNETSHWPDAEPMLGRVCDAGPVLAQRWAGASVAAGSDHRVETISVWEKFNCTSPNERQIHRGNLIPTKVSEDPDTAWKKRDTAED